MSARGTSPRVAAVASAAGVYYTGQSLEATRTQNAVTEQGQLTDRFTKAVDQLDRSGPEHLQARLGAIYALERLARDSPRDHPTIVEVLSAFVRSTAPYRPPIADEGMPAKCPNQPPTVDVQAALTVLGRRDSEHDQDTRVDLTETCLQQVNITKANLVGANLSGADLSGAALGSADLIGALLDGANLSEAVLGDVMFLPADLSGAGISHANLTDARHDQHTDITDVVIDKDTQGEWWR